MGRFASLCAFVAGGAYLAIKLTSKHVDLLKLVPSIALIGEIVFIVLEVICFSISDFYVNKAANIFGMITSVF